MQQLIRNLNFIWNKFKKVDNSFLQEIEEQLILNDVNALTAQNLIEDIKKEVLEKKINNLEQIKNLFKNKIIRMLSSEQNDFDISNFTNPNYFNVIPKIWMFVGVNGVGKTSTVAKIANFFKNLNKSVLLTAADTYRAAAFEQLEFFAKKLGLPIVHHQRYSDPGAVVYDSIEKAISKNIDIVLIDTAGRMHTSHNLMEELKKIKKIIFKKISKEPDEILIVLDSTTGQNAKNQVKIFNEALNLSGIILTKTDGTAKGGIILTIKNELNIPIKFITNGEKLNNLELFNAEKFANILVN